MPKSRSQKEATLQQFVEALKTTKSAIFSGFSGLTVKQTTDLRKELRAEGIDLVVAKRTLFRKALAELKMPEPPEEIYQGGVQVAFGMTDEVAPARIISVLAKKTKVESLKIRGGLLNGVLLTKEQAQALATLPTKDQLRGQLIGLIAAPLRGLVTVLAGPMRGLVTVLQKQSEKISV